LVETKAVLMCFFFQRGYESILNRVAIPHHPTTTSICSPAIQWHTAVKLHW